MEVESVEPLRSPPEENSTENNANKKRRGQGASSSGERASGPLPDPTELVSIHVCTFFASAHWNILN
jgi:hypothetical protein